MLPRCRGLEQKRILRTTPSLTLRAMLPCNIELCRSRRGRRLRRFLIGPGLPE